MYYNNIYSVEHARKLVEEYKQREANFPRKNVYESIMMAAKQGETSVSIIVVNKRYDDVFDLLVHQGFGVKKILETEYYGWFWLKKRNYSRVTISW